MALAPTLLDLYYYLLISLIMILLKKNKYTANTIPSSITPNQYQGVHELNLTNFPWASKDKTWKIVNMIMDSNI